MKGVLDRFEGKFAVIKVEENKEEFTVAKHVLPEASVIGTWFHIMHMGDTYHIQSIDIAATEEKSSANALLMEKSRHNKRENKFKREHD